MVDRRAKKQIGREGNRKGRRRRVLPHQRDILFGNGRGWKNLAELTGILKSD